MQVLRVGGGGKTFFSEFQKTHRLLQEPIRAVLTTGFVSAESSIQAPRSVWTAHIGASEATTEALRAAVVPGRGIPLCSGLRRWSHQNRYPGDRKRCARIPLCRIRACQNKDRVAKCVCMQTHCSQRSGAIPGDGVTFIKQKNAWQQASEALDLEKERLGPNGGSGRRLLR